MDDEFRTVVPIWSRRRLPHGYAGETISHAEQRGRYRVVTRAEAYAAYKDDEGQPRLWPSRVLFFDLLGISAMSTGPAALEDLRKLRPALEAAVDRAATEHPSFTQASTWFTDNAVVGAPFIHPDDTEDLIGGAEVSAAYLLLVCWGQGFLGRGAITFGEHYMDDSFVYGPALIEAVKLEKQARWPRVVLGESAIELERHHSTYYSGTLQSTQNSCLLRDEEDVVFVDHLGIYIDEEDDLDVRDHYLKLHKRATIEGLAKHPRYSEPWLKWRWLADYQNYALASRLVDPQPYLVPVDEVRALFASFLDPTWGTQPGSPWFVMDRRDRYRLNGMFDIGFLPSGPATYAVYRDEQRVYTGETGNLAARVGKHHLGRSPSSIKQSALRRNLAEHLGIAKAEDLKSGQVMMNDQQRDQLHEWLASCEIAWVEHDDKAAARAHERDLLREFAPVLNRRAG